MSVGRTGQGCACFEPRFFVAFVPRASGMLASCKLYDAKCACVLSLQLFVQCLRSESLNGITI